MYSLFNKNLFGILVGFIFLVSMVYAASPANVNLGTAADYVILAKAGISATGVTFINGDIGVSPIDHTAITGFGTLPVDPTGQFSTSPLVSGKIYAGDYASPTPTKLGIAIGDMQTAYTDALSRPTSFLNAGNGAGEIGGLTLATGVYTFTGDSINVLISTDLTLNGTADDVWIFQIPGTFNLANGKKVNLVGGAIAKNIFWVVTGATVLGTDSVLEGTVLDATSISIQTGATLNGNALAQTAVTLEANSINDTTLPIITRIGLMDVNVDFNSSYIDKGATAFDAVDGNLTSSIITFNDVNTLMVGTYVVTYNVTDLSGNSAIQVIRNVNVLDSNKPLIILNGSDLNVVINSIYVDAGATAFDVVDGNLTNSIVVVNSVNTSVLGLYTVTYDVNDLSGNSAIQVIRNVNVVDSIILDTNVPVISLIGSDVNVVYGSIYVDSGATATDNVDGNLTSSIITFNDVNTFLVGTYVVTYNVTDSNGNSAIEVIRNVNVVDSNTGETDITPPVVTEVTPVPSPTTYMDYTFNTNEAGNLIIDCGALYYEDTGMIMGPGNMDLQIPGLGEGNYNCVLTITDLAGNVGTLNATPFVIDLSGPIVSSNIDKNHYNSDVNVILTVTDEFSFVDDVKYSLDGINFYDYDSNILVTGEGSKTVKGYATDEAGNVTNYEITFIIDKTVPVLTLNGSNLNVEINSVYVDAGATAFDVVDGNLTNSIITFNDVNTSALGTYTVTYDVNDLSGNKALQITRTVNVLENGYNIQTNPTTPNLNGWFKALVVVSFVHDANTEIRFCRSDGLNGTSCGSKKNPDWNSTNGLPRFIPKVAMDYNIYSTPLTFSNDANNYIKYFAISGTESVEDFNVANAIVHYLPIDKTAPTQQMFFTVAYAPDSYRGISMSTTSPYPITTTSGLILAKLSLTPSGLDAVSGINYCQVNFDYALDNNNWGARLSAEEVMNLSYRYTTTGAKVIAAFCVDNADNNKMWLSTSVPFYHVTVVDTNYPVSTILLTANPNPLNLNSDYNLIYSVPDGNTLKSVMFSVSGINYSFDINAIKNLDGTFYATVTPDSNRFSGLVNVTAKVTDNSNFVEYFSNDFNSVKSATVISLIASNLTQTSVSFDLNSNNLVDVQLRTDINWIDFVADFNNQTLAVWNLSELSPSTVYTYYVLSLDENQNKIVNTISFTTAATPTTTGGGGTAGGQPITPPAVIPEVETGPTIPDTTDNTNPDGTDTELDLTDTDGTDTNPITGDFGLIGNDSNNVAPTGLFGFGLVSPFWIWLLLLIPAAMLFVASQRIKNQREEAEDEKKRKRDEELAKRSNKK